MRHITTAALLILLISCNSSQVQQQAAQDSVPPLALENDSIPFSGSWVNAAYYAAIHSALSPREAQVEAKYVFIPRGYNDSTLIVYGFHEGGPYRKVVKAGDKYLWQAMEDDEFATKPENISVINDSTIKIGDETFIRISQGRIEGDKVTELLLFSGIYTYQGEEVVLGKLGEIKGLDEFKYYEIPLDYIDQGMNLDLISLGSSKEDLSYFAFKFNQDTLSIYEAPCAASDEEGRCLERKEGELKYILIKQQHR